MKTLIKKLTKTFLFAALIFAGTSFAYAAGTFVNYDPLGSAYGITSISPTDFSGRSNSLSVNIPNQGDSQVFRVYTLFQNIRNNDVIYNAKGSFTFPLSGTQSSTTIRGKLKGDAGESVSDTVSLLNLPSSWEIEMYDAYKDNLHSEANFPQCTGNGAPYNYDVHMSPSSISNGNYGMIDHLDYIGTSNSGLTGSCDQGHLIGYFKITNTETATTTLEVNTNAATSVQQNSAVLHGTLTSGDNADVWFVMQEGSSSGLNCNGTHLGTTYNQNSGDTFSYSVSGLNAGTIYYYRACTEANQTMSIGNILNFTTDTTQNNTLTILTNGANTYSDGATLNGHISTGESNITYFVYGNTSVSCTGPYYGGQNYVASNQNANGNTQYAGSNFNANTIVSLSPGTYYYRACAKNTSGSIIADGGIHSFVIGGNNNGNVIPDVNTTSPSSITENSAKLRGNVDMHDFNNGKVFFVYGQRENYVNDVDSDYNRYGDIDEHGQDLQKVIVDTDLDSSDSYSKRVNGLNRGERYYYRICVEYDNGGDTLECGSLKNFRTDNGGDNNGEVDIRTLTVDSYGNTSATICGDLVNDGGNTSLRTHMEYRRYGYSFFTNTSNRDRGEGRYCETVRNLRENTRYAYRACTENGDCGATRYFTTRANSVNKENPEITTGDVPLYTITAHSARLKCSYLTHDTSARTWFQYGRSANLYGTTRAQTKYGEGGECTHYFSGLKANQRYCYRAVIRNSVGTDYGATKCFTTLPAPVVYTNNNNNGNSNPRPRPKPQPKPVETIVEDTKPDIDLSRLGLGLSLIRLDINDETKTVTKGQNVSYVISWENISDIDLRDLSLNVEIPREVKILAASRGKMDQDNNSIFYIIDRLDAGERNSMTIDGIVEDGTLGDALTANATIAFDNPINQAQENAKDYDVDDYVIHTALGTASVFGLGNITLLGWLTILLGLFIVFLIARWLYLEREELRAQAYVNGYGRHYAMAPVDNRYEYLEAPRAQAPVREVHYVQPNTQQAPAAAVKPAASEVMPVNNQGGNERTDYRPYRPNRG